MRLTILVYAQCVPSNGFEVILLGDFYVPLCFVGVNEVEKSKIGGSNKPCFHILLGPSISRCNMASAWDEICAIHDSYGICVCGVATAFYVLICSPKVSSLPRIASLYTMCDDEFSSSGLSSGWVCTQSW